MFLDGVSTAMVPLDGVGVVALPSERGLADVSVPALATVLFSAWLGHWRGSVRIGG